jgi:putative hydrolase of the HAD superfamily
MSIPNCHFSAYMVEKLGIEESKIENLGNLLYKNYGTTMAGLRAIGYNFDYDEYHSFVHGRLPYDNIKPDPVLKHILKNMRIRKLVRSLPETKTIITSHMLC